MQNIVHDREHAPRRRGGGDGAQVTVIGRERASALWYAEPTSSARSTECVRRRGDTAQTALHLQLHCIYNCIASTRHCIYTCIASTTALHLHLHLHCIHNRSAPTTALHLHLQCIYNRITSTTALRLQRTGWKPRPGQGVKLGQEVCRRTLVMALNSLGNFGFWNLELGDVELGELELARAPESARR
jgi:hypothetical protein